MLRSLRTGKRLSYLIVLVAIIFCMAIPALAVEPKPNIPRQYYAAIHQAPGSSLLIGYLEHGTVLTVLGQTESYYEIDCYGMNGFILRSLVSFNRQGYYVRTTPGGEDVAVRTAHSPADTKLLQRALHAESTAQLGVRYVSGGTTPRGFDCSGFTQYVYSQCGISLTRTCDDQAGEGVIISKESLQCGDLVFFQGTNGMAPIASHVGIYLGDGKLIHAGSRGITIVDLDSDYFTRHYQCSRRILCTQTTQVSVFSTDSRAKTPGPLRPRNRTIIVN